MTPSRKIQSRRTDAGQLLVIGFEAAEMDARTRGLLKKIQPAGVILFARNIKTPQQTWQLLAECRKCVSTPLFTCVDLEGGQVDRFREALGPTPSAATVFSTGKRALYRRHGEIIGANCRALGFNVSFAPVLDLAFEASRKVMSSRAVSDDPRETVRYARELLAGLRVQKVLGCGKHFPGLGEGQLDSHHSLPVIEKPLRKMWAEDLAPYRALPRQLPFVMVAHAAYPEVTGDRTPASLSRIWIEDVLRRRIRYRNLVISDDLEMGGVLAATSTGGAAVGHIGAGGDLALICHREDYIFEAQELLIRTIEKDAGFAARAGESAARVLRFKKKSAPFLRHGRAPSPAAAQKLSAGLRHFGENIARASKAEDSWHA